MGDTLYTFLRGIHTYGRVDTYEYITSVNSSLFRGAPAWHSQNPCQKASDVRKSTRSPVNQSTSKAGGRHKSNQVTGSAVNQLASQPVNQLTRQPVNRPTS